MLPSCLCGQADCWPHSTGRPGRSLSLKVVDPIPPSSQSPVTACASARCLSHSLTHFCFFPRLPEAPLAGNRGLRRKTRVGFFRSHPGKEKKVLSIKLTVKHSFRGDCIYGKIKSYVMQRMFILFVLNNPFLWDSSDGMVAGRALKSLAGCYLASPRQLLPEDEKNWRANCFCSNRLDTGRQEAVDFSLPSNPLLLLFPPHDTICGIINKQGVKFHERRNSSQSVNNSDFDLRQALRFLSMYHLSPHCFDGFDINLG